MVRDREHGEREEPRVSWGARILAPLAFFVAATILILVVNNSLSRDEQAPSAANPPPPAATGATTARTTTQGGAPRRRFYRIREGDTLEVIAQRFDTTVDDLLRLNPGIDANALTPGQRVRIR